MDLTLYDVDTGEAVQMPGLYDEMTERPYPDYRGGTAEQRRRRDLLRQIMEQQEFSVYETEWWHFDYKNSGHYPDREPELRETRRRAMTARACVSGRRSFGHSRRRPVSLGALHCGRAE